MERDLTQASVPEIAQFYQSAGPILRANMVISADGHFIDELGSSRQLSSPLDLKVLLTLRAISDAILVGAKTMRIENYKAPKLGPDYQVLNSKPPKLIVITKSLNFDPDARLFWDATNRPIFITEHSTAENWLVNKAKLEKQSEILEFPAPIDLRSVVLKIRELGYQQIVCEGGPDLLSQLIDFHLVDEIDLTKSSVLLGKPAIETAIHKAIFTWPNRVSAKLGSQQVLRIKR